MSVTDIDPDDYGSTQKHRALIEQLKGRVERAERNLMIACDPQLQERSLGYLAMKYRVSKTHINELRHRAGIRGPAKYAVHGRPRKK